MERKKLFRFVLLVSICFSVLFAFSSCSPQQELGDNTELGEKFVSSVIGDDYDGAYALVKATVGEEDFREYWETTLRPIAKNASSYEIEQIGWNVNVSNGLTTRTTAYQVYLDNGATALLRVVTRDDIEAIAGIHFSDITAFLSRTDALIPPIRIGLTIFSVLSLAFTVWMLVDCLRRKISRKVIWLIVILFGVSLSFTVGETFGFKFMLGLMFQIGTVVADPGLLAVQVKVVVPFGAILYLCLRKRLLLPPEPAAYQGTTVNPVPQATAPSEQMPSENDGDHGAF